MATSGSYNYKLTADGVITEALSLVGVYDPGETLAAADSASALITLNIMLKAWQSQGIGLWLKKEYALFFADGTYSYDVGPSGDHCTTSYVKTEVATAAASAATSLVVDSITGFGNTFDRDGIITATTPSGSGSITLSGTLVTSSVAYLPSGSSAEVSARTILVYGGNDESGKTFTVVGTDANDASQTEVITGPNAGTVYSTYKYKTVTSVTASGATTGNIEVGVVGDFIGIELDDGTVQWTNAAAAVSTTTLTLMDALTDSVAVDNHVYTYTHKAQRPLEIDEVRLHTSDDNERPLLMVSRQEYMALSDKDSAGSPNQVYFNPTRTNAEFRVWPAPDDTKEWIMFTGKYPIQDMDTTSHDIDIPQEWFEALAWNLAVRLAPKYGRPIDPNVLLMAAKFKENVLEFDREFTSVFIQVV